ncbi:MAG: gliding motility protein MglA [Polyangiaceae bacterium]|jgi:signal recognition particle receptor subunit beta|nr:gliding motility protein MglA [Polyangiaceae bacterium]
MPVVNPLARELVFKVVYYGPGLGGKTTTLQHIHATAKPEHRGKMVSLATPVDRTLYFDFLPIRVPHVRGMGVRLQLFTVPGQVHYNATRKLVLTGADGIVMVFDSQRAREDANLETLENLKDNLHAHGKSLREVPHVVQYNKRDLYDVTPIDELERALNRYAAPSFATTATSGEGVYEALEAITRAVMEDFDRRVPESRALERASLEVPEGGLVEALRRAENTAAEPVVEGRLPTLRTPTALRLSELPEADVGEAAARAVTGEQSELQTDLRPGAPEPTPPLPPVANITLPAQSGGAGKGMDAAIALAPMRPLAAASPAPSTATSFSFAKLFTGSEQGVVQVVESALSLGDPAAALSAMDQLVTRSLAAGAALAGSAHDAPRDPGLVVLLLGVEPRRYLKFRTLVREARAGTLVSVEAGLWAYAFVLDLRRALRDAG